MAVDIRCLLGTSFPVGTEWHMLSFQGMRILLDMPVVSMDLGSSFVLRISWRQPTLPGNIGLGCMESALCSLLGM
jgi:hypothetical protein